jgi:hypothetical protein
MNKEYENHKEKRIKEIRERMINNRIKKRLKKSEN